MFLKIFFAYCCSYFNKQNKTTHSFFLISFICNWVRLKYLFTKVGLWVHVTLDTGAFPCTDSSSYKCGLVILKIVFYRSWVMQKLQCSQRQRLNYCTNLRVFFRGTCRMQPVKTSSYSNNIYLLVFIKKVSIVQKKWVRFQQHWLLCLGFFSLVAYHTVFKRLSSCLNV